MNNKQNRANSTQAHEFQSLLSHNGEAANFYENCTPAQKNAILNQVSQVESGDQLQAFVDHLPSQTL